MERSALFEFNLVTCRQDEVFYLARLDAAPVASSGTGLDGAGPRSSTPGSEVVADLVSALGGEFDHAGWTAMEREVLDSVRWWALDELDVAVAAGRLVFPVQLPRLLRTLADGWDGQVRHLAEGP